MIWLILGLIAGVAGGYFARPHVEKHIGGGPKPGVGPALGDKPERDRE